MEKYILIKVVDNHEEILAKGSIEEVEQYKRELEEAGRHEGYVIKLLDKNNGFHRMMSAGLHLAKYKDGKVYLQRMIDNAEIYHNKYILSLKTNINCLTDLKAETNNQEDIEHINCVINILIQKIKKQQDTILDIVL